MTLYDARRVDRLMTWPVLDDAEIEAACPWGLFIGRRDIDVTACPNRLLVEAGEGWGPTVYTCVWIRYRVEQHGFLPFVGTVGGFVGLGADIVGVRITAQGEGALELREPGRWFDTVRHRRLVTGAGPSHLVRGWHPSAGGAHPRTGMGGSTL